MKLDLDTFTEKYIKPAARQLAKKVMYRLPLDDLEREVIGKTFVYTDFLVWEITYNV